MSVVIQVDRLSKQYRLGVINANRLRDDVSRWLAKLRGKVDPLSEVRATRVENGEGKSEDTSQISGFSSNPSSINEFWALKDVSFEVKQGEVVGIIGRNGAGKSTLLKILSRVTDPTSGEARVKGRIASLLEVGTGFNPELTGRDNIFLNGAILGMTKAEIRRKFDEIVAFSEIPKFIDTPVKRYSSGMYVRLAFAVAAHLDPEIMVVDEVLAVGDAEFQKKCLGKMQDISAKGGRTVLFVSHNTEAVLALTHRSILLAQGRVIDDGPTREIIGRYLKRGGSGVLDYTSLDSPTTPSVTHVQLGTSLPNNVQYHGDPMEICVRLWTPYPIPGTRFEICACDESQQRFFHVWLYDCPGVPVLRERGNHEIKCRIPKVRLYPGMYTLLIHLAERSGGKLLQRLEGICPFKVLMRKQRDGGWPPSEGTYIEDANWVIQKGALVANAAQT